MRKDALAAHARHELGFSDATAANPLLAAVASAVSCSLGAVLPTAVASVSPQGSPLVAVSAATILFLIVPWTSDLGGWRPG